MINQKQFIYWRRLSEEGYIQIRNKQLKSRLTLGQKYKVLKRQQKLEENRADMVTVAVRRVNILDKQKPILTDYINPKNNLLT